MKDIFCIFVVSVIFVLSVGVGVVIFGNSVEDLFIFQ